MATTTFTKFAQTVITELQNILTDYVISEQSVTKHNDITLHAVTVRHTDSDTAPTMYLDAFYEDFQNGYSIESIVNTIAEAVINAETITPITNGRDLDMSLDAIRDKLTVRLIDSELNQNYLRSHPYGFVGAGLAVVAEVNLDGNYKCVITNELAEQYGLEMSEVFAIALENMESRYPARLMNMEDSLLGNYSNILAGDGEFMTMGTLMSDGTNGFGAIAIAYNGIADKIREIVGNYYILPSSLHELIILPDSGCYDTAELKNMVVTANKTVVDESDILSNSVFYYGSDGILSRVA